MPSHDLKIYPAYFEEVVTGRKTFELRQNDRNYALGDHVMLQEYVPHRNQFTGRTFTFRISYLLHGSEETRQWGLLPGFVIMAIDPISEVASSATQMPALEAVTVGTTLRCQVCYQSQAATTVEDQNGERHRLDGPSWHPGAVIGDLGTITFKRDNIKTPARWRLTLDKDQPDRDAGDR